MREYLVASFKFRPDTILRMPVVGQGALDLVLSHNPPPPHPTFILWYGWLPFRKSFKMQFKFSVSLNQMDTLVPLLKGHFWAGPLVGSLSIYVYVYIFLDQRFPNFNLPAHHPGLLKCRFCLEWVWESAFLSFPGVIDTAGSCNVHISSVCFTDIRKRLPKFLY